jgi:hypothetical protein
MKFIDRADGVARKLERLVSGNAISDPLCISNRTLGHKIRLAVLLGTPILAVGSLIYLALDKQFDPKVSAQRAAAIEAVSQARDSGAERSARILPDIEKSFAGERSKDLDVVEASVTRAGARTLSGRLRNNTTQVVRAADVVFDVTDEGGSQLGGVSVRVENIPANGTADFQVGVQAAAHNALVREIRSR